MSDEQPRSSGGGAAFVLLIAFGFVVMFRWVFAIITAVLLLAGLAWYACCRLDARDAARAAIARSPTASTRRSWPATSAACTGGPNGVRSYCRGCRKLIFAPPE
jgi:hypothetical protein